MTWSMRVRMAAAPPGSIRRKHADDRLDYDVGAGQAGMGKLLSRHRLAGRIRVDGLPFVDLDDVRPQLNIHPLPADLGLFLFARVHDDEADAGLRLGFPLSPFVAQHRAVERGCRVAAMSPVYHRARLVLPRRGLAVRGDVHADHGTNVRLDRRLD